MHTHFQRREAAESEGPPRRLYAVLDHLEPVQLTNALSALFAFDAVDAERLDALPEFGAENTVDCTRAWREYWESVHKTGSAVHDPFNSLPLYRVETLLERNHPIFESVLESMRYENKKGSDPPADTWYEIHIDPSGALPADLYSRMFGLSVPVAINIRPPAPQRTRALQASFNAMHIPSASRSDLDARLSGRTADALAVYDIGQGSASALTDTQFLPDLYYDLGCGVYRNYLTCPSTLRFCFTRSPPILLSHWDADHWAGAYWETPGSPNFALQQTWIAPQQTLSPIHLAFASDILTNGGRLLMYASYPRTVDAFALSNARTLELVRCSGTDRNDSGYALCVTDASDSERRYWLLTGDASYDYLLPHLDPQDRRRYQAVIAPHHGADLGLQRSIPRPPIGPSSYQRLVFSFGSNNAHGRRSTSHPKQETIDAHEGAGWNVAAWRGVAAPGHRVAGGDVLATSKNGPGCERLHSVVINWKGDLSGIQGVPCTGTWCTHRLAQV